MGLFDQAIKDMQAITSNSGDFAVPVTFTSAAYGTIVTVNAIHNKINLTVDANGNTIHSKNATVAVSEPLLNAAGYVTRNLSKEVVMYKDLVSVKDSTGIVKNYIVKSQMPDETVGLIVLILEDYT